MADLIYSLKQLLSGKSMWILRIIMVGVTLYYSSGFLFTSLSKLM